MNSVFIKKESLILPLSILYLNAQSDYGIYTKIMCIFSFVLSIELLFINVVNMCLSTFSFLIIISFPIYISNTNLIFDVSVYNTIYNLTIEFKKSRPISFITIYSTSLLFICLNDYIICYYFAFYCCALFFDLLNFMTFNIFNKITNFLGDDLKLSLFVCSFLTVYFFLFKVWGFMSDVIIILMFSIIGANGLFLSILRLINNDLEAIEKVYNGIFGSISVAFLVVIGLIVVSILQIRKKAKKKMEEEL